MAFRAGTVAVVGRPNVGKSTLMNFIVGQKVAIVSNKPQTTRKRLLGVANRPGAQIVFLDTPGIHQPRSRMGKAMVDTAIQTIHEADAILFVVDVSKPPGDEDKHIARVLRDAGVLPDPYPSVEAEDSELEASQLEDSLPLPGGGPGWGKDLPSRDSHRKSNIENRVVVALNKMDHLRPQYVQSNYDEYEKLTAPAEMMLTAAITGENVDKLVDLLVQRLPEGDPIYDDPDFYTSQSVREFAAELIREQVLKNTREEVPHGVAVVIDEWQDADPAEKKPLTRIAASIVVERESQKPILIGKGGAMLKKIGTAARQEIEALIGNAVFIELFVKVLEGWRDSPTRLKEFGIID